MKRPSHLPHHEVVDQRPLIRDELGPHTDRSPPYVAVIKLRQEPPGGSHTDPGMSAFDPFRFESGSSLPAGYRDNRILG